MKHEKIWVLIPAAGSGQRLSAQIPKQYVLLGKKTMLEHTISVFLECELIEKIMVAIAPNDQQWSQLNISRDKRVSCCFGADERFKSVYAGLQQLLMDGASEHDWVLVHDAARPCLSKTDLEHLIYALRDDEVGGLLAVPLQDTLKNVVNHQVTHTIKRDGLWRAQTPQMFRLGMLKTALEQVIEKNIVVTDDAMAMELAGYQPKVICGSQNNSKVTYPEDISMVKEALNMVPSLRIGHGYDVHQFTTDRKLYLGGVEIPYEKGLLGHSDADVVLHALCDALLGAAALGDIGQHFPDTATEHKDQDSRHFLQSVYQKIQEKGYSLVNADVTIVAQVPKLAPYIQLMCETIATICSSEISQVNVKATTTEGMGFVGREEGIACYAVVLLAQNNGVV